MFILIDFEGGILASIEDPEEQTFIQDQVSILADGQSSFWIGLYKTHAGIGFTKIEIKSSMFTPFYCILGSSILLYFLLILFGETFGSNNILQVFAILFHSFTGKWNWLDKTIVDYTNWDEDSPDESNSYAKVQSLTGKWTTGRKWNDRAYICKTPKGMSILCF